jgi:hypothetical protein
MSDQAAASAKNEQRRLSFNAFEQVRINSEEGLI